MDEVVEYYLKAGEAVKRAKHWAKNAVRSGAKLLSICEEVERIVERLGCKPAFPCNICIDHVAAHYTPPANSIKTIPDGSLVKVDVGAHYSGFIADSAITVNVNSEHEELIIAVEEALDNVVKELEPRMRVSKISRIIEKTIKYYGFKPIVNLAGHKLAQYKVHTGIIIPNVRSFRDVFNRLEPENAYAIEPFATTKKGKGEVIGRRGGNILKLVSEKPPKMGAARSLFLEIQRNYKTLPFTKRWLTKSSRNPRFERAFKYLMDKGFISEYPMMIEVNEQPVAQAEHTVVVLKKEVIVIT